MQTKNKELKRIARGNLIGHYIDLIRALIFCNVVVSLAEIPFSLMTNDVDFSTSNIIYYIAVLLISIVSVVLVAGQYRLHLTLARSGEIHLSEVFYPVKNSPDRFILAELIIFGCQLICLLPCFGGLAALYFYKEPVIYVLTIALSLISIVLSTYVSLTFGLVYFVLNDNDNFSALEALKHAKELVKTHKWRYLYLQLSFWGISLLSIFTMGLAMLWIEPYMVQTITLFYLDLNGEKERIYDEQKNRQTTIDYYC